MGRGMAAARHGADRTRQTFAGCRPPAETVDRPNYS
jgi:hypothetical protein